MPKAQTSKALSQDKPVPSAKSKSLPKQKKSPVVGQVKSKKGAKVETITKTPTMPKKQAKGKSRSRA